MFDNANKMADNGHDVPNGEQNIVLSLIDIQVLAKIAELRSVTRTAKALGLPKSSVSRNLSRLEADLGVALVQRSGKQLALTSTGTAFYRHALRILGDVEEAQNSVGQLHSSPRGHVRVAAPVASGQLLLAPLMLEFLNRYPQVTVALELTSRHVDPAEEQVDVVIHVGPLANSRLVARKLGEFPIWLYGSPAYLAARGTPASVEELSRHDVLDLFDGPRNWKLASPEREASVGVTPRFSVNDLSTVKVAAVGGSGLACLPPFMCAEDVAAGRLLRVLPQWSRGTREVHALFPSPRTLSSRVRALIDFLIERFPHGAS